MKTIEVRVKPKARVSRLEQMDDGRWIARVKSPPEDGKANEELIELVAQHFQVRKSQVSIRTAISGRTKLIRIRDK